MRDMVKFASTCVYRGDGLSMTMGIQIIRLRGALCVWGWERGARAHGWILQVHHHGDSSLAVLARNDRMGVGVCLRTGRRRRGVFSPPSRDHRLPLEWA